MSSRRSRALFLVCTLSLLASLGTFGAAPVALAATLPVVDDFEAALPTNIFDGPVPIGFFIAQDGGSTTTFARTATPPAPVPGSAPPNNVLQMGFNVVNFGVVIHGFENPAGDQWITQDWSSYGGLAFWLYGNNSGTDLFVDVIDNRPAGSTTDNAERFSIAFKDDFSGWKLIELPFESFARKEIGNGAPNDGFTLTEVHGWAFGTLTTATPQTYYLDDVKLYGTAPVRPLTVSFVLGDTECHRGPRRPRGREAQQGRRRAGDGGLRHRPTAWRPRSATICPQRARSPSRLACSSSRLRWRRSTIARTRATRACCCSLKNASGAELGLPPLARLNIRDNDATEPLAARRFRDGAVPVHGVGQSQVGIRRDQREFVACATGPGRL